MFSTISTPSRPTTRKRPRNVARTSRKISKFFLTAPSMCFVSLRAIHPPTFRVSVLNERRPYGIAFSLFSVLSRAAVHDATSDLGFLIFGFSVFFFKLTNTGQQSMPNVKEPQTSTDL